MSLPGRPSDEIRRAQQEGGSASQAPRGHRARTTLKKLAHLLMVVLGWVGFAWMWSLVAARPWESQRLLWLIVGSLVLMPLITGAWVWHNRALSRRKGERLTTIVADMSYARDWHGRAVQADWAALRRSRVVLVDVDGAHKRFVGNASDTLAHDPPSAIPTDHRTAAAAPATTIG